MFFISFGFTAEYLYVAEAAGQQLTEAHTRTPLLGPTGPACNLSFDFALTGSLDHIGNFLSPVRNLLHFLCLTLVDSLCAAGELSVRVIDSLLGPRPKLWEFSGKTGAGEEEESWQHADILIGVRKHRFQVCFHFFIYVLCTFVRVRICVQVTNKSCY